MSSTPPLDVQLDLLANAERRRALTILAESKAPLTLRDLATELASRDHDAPLLDIPSGEVTNTFARLHHVHIPKLVHAGVLDYDADRRRIDEISLDGLAPTLTIFTAPSDE